MYKSYFKIILRQARSIYSTINLIGLFVGFTAFLLTYSWVASELSYDRFHKNHTHIFRITENQLKENNEVYPVALTPGPLAGYLQNTYAEVEHTCRLLPVAFLLRHEETAYFHKGLVADPSFFDVFTYPFVEGDVRSFYKGSDKIIISEKLARSFFGNSSPIGKIFQVVGRDLLVTGVIKNPTVNSHLQFDYVIPFDFFKATGLANTEAWNWNSFHTYLTLASNINLSDFENKIRHSIADNNPEIKNELALQALADIHLKSEHLNNDTPGRGNFQYVLIFVSVSIFILVIASVNYANLTTARAIKRAKEVGVRKVIGASRWQVISLLFSESLLYSMFAFLLACVAAWLLLPHLNTIAGKEITLDIFSPSLLLPLITSIFLCAILGGVYPAFFLSQLNTVAVLKGFVKTNKAAILFRRGLVVLQFGLSIVFLSGTLIVQKQLNFIQSRNLGFEKENIISFSTNRNLRQQYPEFKNELLKNTGIQSVTASNTKLSYSDHSTSEITWEGKNPNEELLIHQIAADYDFVKTFSIEIAEGRDFSIDIASDSNAVLLNESAIQQMKLNDPINKRLVLNEQRELTIIGVVKDFNFKSAHKKIEPALIYIEPESFYEISVRLAAGNLSSQVKNIESVHKKFNPYRPFEYSFLDEDIDKLYRDEQRTEMVFKYFAVMSIFISCLGLLGISIFVTEQRGKEIAVRKVMGASSVQLTWILSFEIIILVVVAFLIATPIMYYVSDLWLKNFAYRTTPDFFIFMIAGLTSLGIGWLTVGVRSYRVAKVNPVKSLRSE